jgi:hypothetical protein
MRRPQSLFTAISSRQHQNHPGWAAMLVDFELRRFTIPQRARQRSPRLSHHIHRRAACGARIPVRCMP